MTGIRQNKSDIVFDVINTVILVIVLMIVLYPLVFVISASISNPMAV